MPSGSDLVLPNGSRVPLPGSNKQSIRFAPRYDKINADINLLDNNTRQLTFVGGLIVNITYAKAPAKPGDPPGVEEMEFAADAGVVVVRGAPAGDVLNGVTTGPDPATG